MLSLEQVDQGLTVGLLRGPSQCRRDLLATAAAADPRRDVSALGDVLVQHLVEHGHEVVVLGAGDVFRSR